MRQMLLTAFFLILACGPIWAVDDTDGSAVRPTAEETTRYADLDSRWIQEFTNVDLSDYLSLRSKLRSDGEPVPADDVGFFATKSLAQPYRLNALQHSLGASDCITFVERNLAMAVAHDWRSYYLIRQRLRSKDGSSFYKDRNFFTLGDWLPNNTQWLLEDITASLGSPPVAEPFVHFVRPKVFEDRPAAPGSKYIRTIFKGSDMACPNPEARQDMFISWKAVPNVVSELQTGDIALVIYTARNTGEKGCDHMGIIERDEDGTVWFVHSAPPKVRKDEMISFATRFERVDGLKFLRIRDGARSLAASELSKMEAAGAVVREPAAEDARVAKLRP